MKHQTKLSILKIYTDFFLVSILVKDIFKVKKNPPNFQVNQNKTFAQDKSMMIMHNNYKSILL